MADSKNTLLTHAVKVLDCFSLLQPELGVREVARLTGLSTSTAGRLMAALKELGLLKQNPLTRVYYMGTKPLEWAGVVSATLDIRTKALPYMEDLHRKTNETISLYVPEGNDRLCVERIESSYHVRIVNWVGRRLPLHAGSAGKAILAFMPAAQQEVILASLALKPFTDKTIVDINDLRRELLETRRLGYAVSHGEWVLEASGVAAPVLNRQQEVLAALCISGPSQRFAEEHMPLFIKEVTSAARLLSNEIG
ncbi:MAG: IclR family transcriptional regulator [Anaerolineae bacterium]|nr:IclR family transcriptional regulator [Anaerolineae bacterium]